MNFISPSPLPTGRSNRPHKNRVAPRHGFTLIEIVVTMTIIVILLAISLPVFQRVRENARDTQCRANLRQLGTGLHQYATRMGYYSSGAWDWRRDGAITEVGWVADLVRAGTPVGDLLCPASQLQISKVYAELLTFDPATNQCADSIGGKDQTMPDGTVVVNPCRAIGEASTADAKMTLIRDLLFTKGYNTNYAASWFLVRGEVMINDVGALVNSKAGCATTVRERSCTSGPLPAARITNGKAPSNTIPMLGCAGLAEDPEHMLNTQLDEEHPSGSFLADSYSLGPRDPATLKAPVITGSGTGIKRWFAGWNTAVQDYRAFGPQHFGQTSGNILMFDGSVQSFIDANGDKLFNNGYPASSTTGFTSDEVELPEAMVYSRWSLDKARVR